MNEKTKEIRKIANRKDLIKYFEKGSLPTEEHFVKLINSNFNKADDRLDIDEDNGLMIYPTIDGKLINFFEGSDDENSKYQLSISSKGMFINQLQEKNKADSDKDLLPEFFIEGDSGHIGLGTHTPKQKLDVQGLITAQGVLGNYKEGDFPADGQWHNIFDKNLIDVHAFQVMAYARGKINDGKYSLLHAIASAVHGRSEISKTVSHFGHYSNKINMRWVAKRSKIEAGKHPQEEKNIFHKIYGWFLVLFEPRMLEYNLQMRTMRHYGSSLTDKNNDDDIKVFYKISLLWSPDIMPRKSAK